MKSVVTFGELMLRLTPPGHNVLLQTPELVATFGGAEANVAVALAAYGDSAKFVSAFPDNDIGRAAVSELRRFGVNTDSIKISGSRMGIYYTQTGSNMRPSKVIYDRAHASVAELVPGDIDWDTVLADADWFHVTGITPALSESLCAVALQAVKACHDKGITVSCDLNYRKNLWKWGKSAIEVMPEFVKYVDVLIANEEDCQKCLGIKLDVDVDKGEIDANAYRHLADTVMAQYPIKALAVSLRESKSADINGWSGVLAYRDRFSVSRKYDITDIVDRIGGGDSFGGSLIYAMRHFGDDADRIINFAIAGSALKHTIYGDFVRFTKEDVEALAGGSGSGRVQR